MNPYLILALIGLALPIVLHIVAHMRPNIVVGVKLSAAYASREMWQETNQ